MPLIDCPVCEGEGRYHYEDIHGRHQTGVCTACRGSCVLPLEDDQYQKHIWYVKIKKRRKYSPEESKIIRESSTAKKALERLIAAGYTDRSYRGVINWRGKHGIRSHW